MVSLLLVFTCTHISPLVCWDKNIPGLFSWILYSWLIVQSWKVFWWWWCPRWEYMLFLGNQFDYSQWSIWFGTNIMLLVCMQLKLLDKLFYCPVIACSFFWNVLYFKLILICRISPASDVLSLWRLQLTIMWYLHLLRCACISSLRQI